ncbi:MAG TPA: molybdopterin-synthase adenylyltransferase MoeB [Bryobacteraceae bacterium]|nr:molybdopterin-synthase adenylyltransferase MoeB [Bryobacteraceae bacterium]
MSATLSKEEIGRYSRHLIMPEVGMDGQLKLKNARVLLIGTGGLGAPVAMYLAAAGVGKLGLVDFDTVDVSNLQRQVIHGTKDVGKKKVDSAEETMKDINPFIEIVKYEVPLTSANALDIIREYDIVADGTDNFPTRFLVNDACVLLGIPNVYASIFRFEGQATVFCKDEGPCYRCLYPEPPPPGLVPSCAEGGVLGILPGVVGLIQATEVIKLILGEGQPLQGRLMLYDALAMKFRELKIRRNPECSGKCSVVKELIDYQQFCGVPHEEAPLPAPVSSTDITPQEVKQLIDGGADFTLVDVREPHEYQICKIDKAKLIPLGDLPKRLDELDKNADIVMHCKMGGRSAKACDLLRASGFTRVRNMTGGILAWADKVDPSLPKY